MQEHDGDDLGAWAEFGTATGRLAARASDPSMIEAQSGFGDRPDLDGLPAVTGFGSAPSSLGGGASVGAAVAHVTDLPAPEGYDNEVDADGDGILDHATYRGSLDGGADILVDLNGDGRTDFVGHDSNLDNRVDYADYDKDHDGVFEKRMFDHDGDGYLD